MKFKLTILGLFSLNIQVSAIEVTEKMLVELAKIQSASFHQSELLKLQGELQSAQASLVTDSRLGANFNYHHSDEKQFTAFVPVTSPYKSFGIDLSKGTTHGVAIGARVGIDQMSNNFIHHGSTSTAAINASVDLWKDFLGKTTKLKIQDGQLQSQLGKLQTEQSQNMIIASVRKLYWSLVANMESQRLLENLIQTSMKQVDEAKKRFANNIADEGEVARYKSQTANRKATLLSLKFREKIILKSLREFVLKEDNESIVLGKYDLEKAVIDVVSCSAIITSLNETPWDYTTYDETASFFSNISTVQSRVATTVDDPELKLTTELGLKGKAFGYSDSWDNLQDDKRKSFDVGVKLNIPFGESISSVAEIQKKIAEKSAGSKAIADLQMIKSTHVEIKEAVGLLNAVIANQQENSNQLEISLRSSKKKYQQARLSVQQLVLEQDAFLQSELDVIQTKLTIMHTLLDYFAIFQGTPCSINKI